MTGAIPENNKDKEETKPSVPANAGNLVIYVIALVLAFGGFVFLYRKIKSRKKEDKKDVSK